MLIACLYAFNMTVCNSSLERISSVCLIFKPTNINVSEILMKLRFYGNLPPPLVATRRFLIILQGQLYIYKNERTIHGY